MNAILTVFLFFAGTLTGLSELVFTHLFQDQAGKPLSGILIRANPVNGNPATMVEQRTAASGAITITLADGEWFIEIDQRELLERGYFCVPGDCLSPTCVPDIIDAVPLTPTLAMNRSLTGTFSVVANFDWINGIEPVLYRRYRIERSTDMINWAPVSSILLSDPPIRIIDPEAPVGSAVYYRATEEESFQVRPLTLAIARP